MKLDAVAATFEKIFGIRPPDGTWRRWVITGLASKSHPGERIRLKVVKYGGRVMTDEAWVREFVAATSANLGLTGPAATPTAAENNPTDEAERYLDSEMEQG